MSILDSSITPPLVVLVILAGIFLLARHFLKTLVMVVVAEFILLIIFPSLVLTIAKGVDMARNLVGLHR